MRRSSSVAIVIGLCLFLLAGISDSAKAYDESPQDVAQGMSEKLVRGVSNAATGWVELPKQIVLTFQNDGVTKGIFVGPLKGLGMTIVRTVSGVAEIVTFFHPAPGFYEPYFEPEFVWQKE